MVACLPHRYYFYNSAVNQSFGVFKLSFYLVLSVKGALIFIFFGLDHTDTTEILTFVEILTEAACKRTHRTDRIYPIFMFYFNTLQLQS